ncbi:hypothetical protein [Acinetobacter sp. ANC 3832]|uniref:hypothetical protein n=1 Tax=Acinetobacter sp. ANC 3832 TaxID=1977874 RepID=UPI000A337861|nr:hypothetical protein [Acinetobacter sp. ANC 3832]OTG93289.1 hypothetical protein B9T35_09765 [Acinetobacter sp. ANC 3832]
MLLKFATRFAGILFGILALIAIIIHFVFSNKLAIDLWIVFFPVILAVPILISVLITGDDELDMQSS